LARDKKLILMDKKKIAIIGLGGVGGYFGFKINEANQFNKYHIAFVARGKTYQKVKQDGLKLLSAEYNNNVTFPNEVTEVINSLHDFDLIFICVKEYDLENVCLKLKDKLNPKTILIPLMNGADIYDRVRKIIPKNTILPSCVYVASHIKEKGIVEHKGKPGKLIFGKDPGNSSTVIDWVIELFKESNIDYDFNENPFIEIWTKFMFIASFGMVTAKFNSSIGKVCTDKNQRKIAAEIMEEIMKIAEKKKINLDKDIIEKTFNKASTFPPETPTSLQLDIQNKSPNNELELLAGSIINYAGNLNIQVPKTENLYKELRGK